MSIVIDVSASEKENHYKTKYEDYEEFYGDAELRWSQIASRNCAIQALQDGIRTILICMPTGCGKTLTIACTLDCPEIRQTLNVPSTRKLKVVFMAHIHRLLTQAERTFAEEGNVELTLVTPFTNIDPKIFEEADLVVIDEAHHEAMMSIQLQLDKMINKPIIGLTATPDRADGMVIKFEKIIEVCTRDEAVAEGWLAETSIWSFIDTTGRVKTPILTNIFNQYHETMGSTIVFCKTRAEVAALNYHLGNTLGRRTAALINQSASEINDILDDFSAAKYDFILNCSKIGEGIDVKGCVSVCLGRQLGSYPLLNQYIGRSARPDSDSQVFELINPLTGRNLDTTVVTGTPKQHKLCAPLPDGSFRELEFDYTSSFVPGVEEHKSAFLDR